jgi:hypothetical protein
MVNVVIFSRHLNSDVDERKLSFPLQDVLYALMLQRLPAARLLLQPFAESSL